MPNDQFGLPMVYPTNINGLTYFIPSNLHTLESETNNVGRFYDDNKIFIYGGFDNDEGDEFPTIEEVTTGIFKPSDNNIDFEIGVVSGNYDIELVNRDTDSKLEAGYMVNPKDFRNFEATIELKPYVDGITDFTDDQSTLIQISGRKGIEWGLSEYDCEGAGYFGAMSVLRSEIIHFIKSTYRNNGVTRATFQTKFPVNDRQNHNRINSTFLFKVVMFDLDVNGAPTLDKSKAVKVKIELYGSVDSENDYAEFFKLGEAIDNGGWGDGGDRCGGEDDQINLWGGFVVTFRFKNFTGEFSRLSVREIDPTSTFTTPPPPPTNPPPTTDPPTNNPPPEPPINSTNVNDSLGVRKIYKTKTGGSLFIHTPDGLLTNTKFKPNNSAIVSSGNGVYRVTPSDVDLQFASTEVARNRAANFVYPTYNSEQLRVKGFWDSSTDFNNCEVTMYIRHISSNSTSVNPQYSIVTQTVEHNSSSNSGCGGSGYQADLLLTGILQITKELRHPTFTSIASTTGLGAIQNRWIGIKFITYNISENRKLEIWTDVNNSNNWVKSFEFLDTNNNLGTSMDICGALRGGQAITWGSPYVFLSCNDLEFDIAKISVREIALPVERVTSSDTGGSTGGGTGGGGGGAGLIDNNGIKWLFASGQMLEIPNSRDDPGDHRWSEVFQGMKVGYEATVYFTPTGTNSSAHIALKHWGGNHCGDCQYEEGGSCCCWYDTGLRENGDIQTQIERPHPNNDDWACPTCLMSNIGISFEGNTIGVKWLIYPIVDNGDVDNGGVKLKMWVDTSGYDTNGRPKNNWRLVYDITDTGQIMDNYPAPDEQEIEMRQSDTNESNVYTGSLWARRLVRPGDLTGNQNPPDPNPPDPDPGGGTDPDPPDPPDPPDNPGTGTPARQVARYVMMHDNLIDRSGTVCAADQTPPPITYSEHYTVTTITDDQELGDPLESHNNRLRCVEYCANTSSMLYTKKYAKAEFYIKKVGLPTGTVYIEMYDSNADNPNIKVEYGTIDAATVTESYVLYSRTNDNAPSLVPEGMGVGWSIGVRFAPTFTDETNYIVVGQNWDNPIDSTNSHIAEWEDSNNDGDYAYDTPFPTTRDMAGKLYTITGQ